MNTRRWSAPGRKPPMAFQSKGARKRVQARGGGAHQLPAFVPWRGVERAESDRRRGWRAASDRPGDGSEGRRRPLESEAEQRSPPDGGGGRMVCRRAAQWSRSPATTIDATASTPLRKLMPKTRGRAQEATKKARASREGRALYDDSASKRDDSSGLRIRG